jgi:hypothetical protein
MVLLTPQICEFIVLWNTTYWYNASNNSQAFVTNLLGLLGLKVEGVFTRSTAVGRYLLYLREVGQESVRVLIRADGSVIPFPDHSTLDSWHNKHKDYLQPDETVSHLSSYPLS